MIKGFVHSMELYYNKSANVPAAAGNRSALFMFAAGCEYMFRPIVVGSLQGGDAVYMFAAQALIYPAIILCVKEGSMNKQDRMNRIFTVPNILSFFRILMIPLIIVFSNNKLYTAAGITVLVSGLTDIVDGYIARHFDQVSRLGKALDPVADYLTQIALTYCIAKLHPIVMLLFVILLVKQILMGIGGLIVLGRTHETFSAKWWGKLATFMLYASMALILLIPSMPAWLITTLTVLCTLVTLFSLYKYMPVFRAALSQKGGRNLR